MRAVTDEETEETTEDLMSEGCKSVIEAAKFIGSCRRVIYTLMESGELPWVQVRGSRKIPVVCLKRYLARNLQQQAN